METTVHFYHGSYQYSSCLIESETLEDVRSFVLSELSENHVGDKWAEFKDNNGLTYRIKNVRKNTGTLDVFKYNEPDQSPNTRTVFVEPFCVNLLKRY